MNERSRSFLLPRLGSRRHRIPQDLSHQHAAWRVAFPVHRRPDAPSMPPTLPQGWPLPSSPGPAGCFHPEPPPKARARLAPANHLLPKALPRGQVTFWSLSHQSFLFLLLPTSMAPWREDVKQAEAEAENPSLPAAFAGFHSPDGGQALRRRNTSSRGCESCPQRSAPGG